MELSSTAVGRWYADRSARKSHWRTRVAYYRAADELIAAGGQISWRDVVDCVEPQGSRATFYDIAGSGGVYSLHRALATSDDPQSLYLAWCYRRTDAVERLIDETKVWSFWAYRESARPGDITADIRAGLAEWSDRHPALAAALDCAPPMCAVEDLVRFGRSSPNLAFTRLAADIASTVRVPVGG